MTRHALSTALSITALTVLYWAAIPASAVEVGLAGVLGNKAMLVINGGSPRTVAVGEQTREGVKLISAQGETAVIEADGRRQTLRVGVQASYLDTAKEITLFAKENNHFVAEGSINGYSMRFLVDTGASLVSIGRSDARRLAIDLKQGRKEVSNTANGIAVSTVVTVNRVAIGSISLNNVQVMVMDRDMPFALLGMNFLDKMDMRYEGSKMILKQRF